jgi:homoserine kinase
MKQLTKKSFSAAFKLFLSRAQIFALILAVIVAGTSVNAAAAEKKIATMEARAMAIKERVTEIQAMDFSKLSAAERKELRHELKDMKQELRQHPTGIYISGAGLILIIILLILLL